MKLLRTLRLDRSDTFVFEQAAEPGEWASPGSFMFWGREDQRFQGKERAAFRSGFLGLTSFGWSTLVEVAQAEDAELERSLDALASLLLKSHGAPSLETARAAAREEIEFAASLADHPIGTVIALQRTIEADGAIRDRFRTIRTTLEPGANTFAQGCVQPIGIEREDSAAEKVEEVDLLGLMRERQ